MLKNVLKDVPKWDDTLPENFGVNLTASLSCDNEVEGIYLNITYK